MEGIRELAIAYYERSTEEEKEAARCFFKRLDENGDGKVCFSEFKRSVTSWLSKEKIFKQLDVNGDGALEFNEVLALYYMEKGNLSLCCSGCSDLLVGPFFSCFLCLRKYPNSVDLCCDCYRKGDFEHEHEISNFLNHHSLLNWFMTRHAKEESTQRKREMEELREVARAHYRAGSHQVKVLAYDFFNSMDSDRDGRVDLSEFLAFMRQEGHHQMRNPYFFKELDRDGNGTLDFMEVMTLYYIIKSGRPFCDFCGNFVPGMFFSCVECSFTLCFDCYRSRKCKHNHNGRTQFLDNYTLLQARHESSHATLSNQYKPTPNNVHHSSSSPNASTALVPAFKVSIQIHHSDPRPNASTAIVPASKKKWNVAFKAFEGALAIGNIASTLCTIL